MAFQKEHDLADEYYNYKGDDVGFTHLVRLDAIYYCFILKKKTTFLMQSTNWSFLREFLTKSN